MESPVDDLRSYLDWQESRGRLLRVREPMSPILEIPSFLRQVMYQKGPTVLFENIKGYPGWRIAGNVFDDIESFRQAIGVEKLEGVGQRLVSIIQSPAPTSFGEKLSKLFEAKSLASALPSKVRKAPFTENIVEDKPLDVIPAFKTWPGDGGRYITFGLVITRDPETGSNNMGVYRIMILDGNTGVIHWQIHKRGAKAYQDMIAKGEKMPVAIAIGADPATLFAGVAPVPPPMDKLLFAGIVRGRGLKVYELSNGLLVPANAEVVVEGYVVPGEEVEEGPFGDHWGFYDKPMEKYPVFHVERVYYRSNPVYVGTIVGLPPLEDAVIGKAIERVFLPIMRMVFPEIVDVDLPVYGVFQGAMIVSIKKRYPGHGKKVALGLMGVGQTSLTKIIVVVDDFVNVHDYGQVLWAITSFVNPERDVQIVNHAHTDALDPAATAPGLGSKMIVDATRKSREEAGRDPPEIVAPDPEVEERVKTLLQRYGLRAADPWEDLVKGYLAGIPARSPGRAASTRLQG